MQSVADFFQRHLANLKDTPLLDGYDHYAMDCDIRFTDLATSWQIIVTNGCITRIEEKPAHAPSATVIFEVNEPVFWNIVHGKISPQMAFFKRQTQIKGDLFQGMKLAKILALFFAKYPYHPKD